MNGLIGLVSTLAGPLLDRFFPDPTARAAAELDLFKAQQAGELKELDAQLQIALAQAATNTAEASDSNIFKSGWRPAIGWVCVAAFAYAGLVRPLGGALLAAYGHPVNLPPIDDVFSELLFGMLGLGSFRTFEKIKRKG